MTQRQEAVQYIAALIYNSWPVRAGGDLFCGIPLLLDGGDVSFIGHHTRSNNNRFVHCVSSPNLFKLSEALQG